MAENLLNEIYLPEFEKKQIRDFKKKLNTMLKSLAFKSKNA